MSRKYIELRGAPGMSHAEVPKVLAVDRVLRKPLDEVFDDQTEYLREHFCGERICGLLVEVSKLRGSPPKSSEPELVVPIIRITSSCEKKGCPVELVEDVNRKMRNLVDICVNAVAEADQSEREITIAAENTNRVEVLEPTNRKIEEIKEAADGLSHALFEKAQGIASDRRITIYDEALGRLNQN
jgi:hypothetical protein